MHYVFIVGHLADAWCQVNEFAEDGYRMVNFAVTDGQTGHVYHVAMERRAQPVKTLAGAATEDKMPAMGRM